jgi:hypothetical protein
VGKDWIGSAVVRGMMVGFGQLRNEMCGSIYIYTSTLPVLRYGIAIKTILSYRRMDPVASNSIGLFFYAPL